MFLKLFLVGLVALSASSSFAFATFNTSASTGYYRDDQQNPHLPLIYSFSYNGVTSKRVETSVDFFMSNDFYQNQWSVTPSQAMVVVPLSEGLSDAPYKSSRVQLGRQLFLDGFDISILDGLQLPIYWSRHGGFWLYGGNAHVLDLLDSTAAPLAGGSIFQEVEGFQLRGGYGARQNQLTERYSYGSVMRNFENIWLSPTLLSKLEYDLNNNSWSQSLNQLQLNPRSDVSLSLSHSNLKPRKLTTDQNQFVYYILSQSAQETEQLSLQFQATQEISMQAFGRIMRFNTDLQMETANQQEISLTWILSRYNNITPVVGHIQGYGGELLDTGVRLKSNISELTTLTNELSAAYLSKINNIVGWAYQIRSGLSYNLGARWVSTAWLELERNHLFLIDARVVANVTYFN